MDCGWTIQHQFSIQSTILGLLPTIQNKRHYIWKAQAENKCTIFTWILIQKQSPHVRQPCSTWIAPSRCLCFMQWPTRDRLPPLHRLPFCTNSMEPNLQHFEAIDMTQHINFTTLADWWDNNQRLIPKERKHVFNGLVIYTCEIFRKSATE